MPQSIQRLEVARLSHLRRQLDHRSVHGEPPVAMMVDGPAVLLRRIDPCLEHLKDEQIVGVHEPRIRDLTFQIGKTLLDQWRRHVRGWQGR